MKTRKVKVQEVWPHTIANEESGESITSEEITLSKFFTCFTLLMNTCKSRTEAKGRSAFLHAISMILRELTMDRSKKFSQRYHAEN